MLEKEKEEYMSLFYTLRKGDELRIDLPCYVIIINILIN